MGAKKKISKRTMGAGGAAGKAGQRENRAALGKLLVEGGTGAVWGKGDFGQLKKLGEKAEQQRKSVGKGGR